jgi:hypothetical protein
MPMMLLNSLTTWFRKRILEEKSQPRPTIRVRLEELEDRVVPAFFAATYTNASVQVMLSGFNVTEKVTATVTTTPSFDPFTGVTTPIPAGAGNNPTAGGVLFSLNNSQSSVASVDANGQATATFTVPLLAFLTSQTLQVRYLGSFPASGNDYGESQFLAPLYLNFDNLMFGGNITFNQLTPQQVSGTFLTVSPFTQTALGSFNTAQGETNSVLNGLIKFNYVDPGSIDSVSVFGFNITGGITAELIAFQLGAYNGL